MTQHRGEPSEETGYTEMSARIGNIPMKKMEKKAEKPFTSTFSFAAILGLYLAWASLFF